MYIPGGRRDVCGGEVRAYRGGAREGGRSVRAQAKAVNTVLIGGRGGSRCLVERRWVMGEGGRS